MLDHRKQGVGMKFAMFYEIPVPKPWTPGKEHRAYKDVVEQVKLGDKVGFHSVWTVEHHFLEEYSHCSNPEVLYGHLAAVTENIRLGYGVRLMPKPYNHPIRTAESVAVLDLLSDGRVEFGTGRSATRMELEGFGIHPDEARPMWQEGLEMALGAMTNDEFSFDGTYWQMPPRRVLPKPLQDPHPPVWAATASDRGHRLIGELGLGLLSFAVGTPPEELKRRIDIYRRGIAACEKPMGAFVNDQAASFTMVNVAPTTEEAVDQASESFTWYPKHGAQIIGSVAQWLEEMEEDLGTYDYLASLSETVEQGLHEHLTMDYLMDTNACVCGDPDRAIEMFKAYEATGCDLVFCLFNPYSVSHEACMQTIEMMGEHVIPAFA
jgi:alkanesulfonate monooxygenase SsuD/methylene tetrahydromethanopterin reductase-like flavin-dependent oxidoreductase (luciferase family)